MENYIVMKLKSSERYAHSKSRKRGTVKKRKKKTKEEEEKKM